MGGDDLVLGGDGDDTLNGGSCNDTLYGGNGNDTYVLNLGDGKDTIIETHGNDLEQTTIDTGELDADGNPILTTVTTDTGHDTLAMGEAILQGDITITQSGAQLIFSHSNGQDQMTINNWFNSLSDDAHRLDSVTFSDGNSYDFDAMQLGTTEADTLTGTTVNDILIGIEGDDPYVVENAANTYLFGFETRTAA